MDSGVYMDIFFNLFGIRSIVFWDYLKWERKFYETVKGNKKMAC